MDDGTLRYSIYHKSFADWLTDPDLRGTRYYISRRDGHRRLAETFAREYEQGVESLSLGRPSWTRRLPKGGRIEAVAWAFGGILVLTGESLYSLDREGRRRKKVLRAPPAPAGFNRLVDDNPRAFCALALSPAGLRNGVIS